MSHTLYIVDEITQTVNRFLEPYMISSDFKKTMKVIASRPDMAVIINYIYKGKGYSVTIPAGYEMMSLLDENGYCGFLYLGSIFGTTELK